MKIKMIKSAAGPKGVFQDGKSYIVPDDLAKEFIQAGAAAPIKTKTEAAELSVDDAEKAESPERAKSSRNSRKRS